MQCPWEAQRTLAREPPIPLSQGTAALRDAMVRNVLKEAGVS